MHIRRGESHKEEDILLWENLVLLYACFLVTLWCFELLLVSMLCCSHRIVFMCCIRMPLCFIDCMFGWSFALLYDHCTHFHMTVMCLIKLLICFTSCLLDRILFVTFYLSFYHLIYLEGLMCFVQVFQVTSICSKFIIGFRFRCEWVLPLFPNSHLSLEFVIRCVRF